MKLHLLGWAGCSRAMIGPLYEGRRELVAPDERPWNQASSACLAGAKRWTGGLPGTAGWAAQELPHDATDETCRV